MLNRSRWVLLMLAGALALTVSADAQVLVSSHTTIEEAEGTRRLIPECKTLMEDATTKSLYPNAGAICTLNQHGIAIQALPECFGNPVADCTVAPVNGKLLIEGQDYQATAEHDLIFQLLPNCTQNCFWDPLSYGLPAGFPIPATRQFTDTGQVPFGNVQSFWSSTNGSNVFLIGLSTETQFLPAQVLPLVFHAKAKDVQQFTLKGLQNAEWTFTGSAGTTNPVSGSQGTSITFTAPSTVPVPQVDTLQGCKVDTSHGTDCNSVQIFVEVLGVSIDPANPNELLGGETFPYAWTVTQGGQIINSPVTWAVTSDTSGGLDLTNFIDKESGVVTVPPQSVFQGKDFFVDIQATSTIDPAVAFSAPFAIHIPTVSVTMTTTPTPGLNEPPFEGRMGRVFDFAATVSGPNDPKNRQITSWGQNFIPTMTNFAVPGQINFPDPNNPNLMEYVISHPPLTSVLTTTITACVGGTIDPISLGLRDGICASYPLTLSPPIIPTSPSPTINSGESTAVTITGTGFGAAPVLSFSDPTVSFTPVSVSGPNANGVTTVTGTMTSAPVPPPIPFHLVTIPVTITSSLPPPSTPVNQSVSVWPVNVTPAVTPVNPTLLVSQSQQFTPTLGCLTRGGQPCTVPQTSTCSLFTGVGTMSASCLYTAPASLAAQTQVQGKACFTFGNICTGLNFTLNLVPVSVAVSPAAVSLQPGQSQQFQATVTNAPNNNQGVTWSISPAVGSITTAGLYTAPAVVSTTQSITVTACSVVDTTHCSSVTVTLFPPLLFVPVAPCRVADTRNANGPFGGPFLAANVSRGFTIPASACGIPSAAQAYAVNATVVPRGPMGNLTLFACGQTLPLTSNLNSPDGRTKAVAAIVAAGTTGSVCAYPSGDTDFILDISGYFVPATTSGALAFFPLTPCRIADTRNATGSLGGPSLVANTARTFPVLSSTCGVPSTAQAYSLNFTAIPPGILGFLTAWPAGQSQPAVSTLNAVTGAVTANAAIVKAGTSGSINVLASATTDLAIDINGYFAPPATGGLSLFSLTPCRVLDTRNPPGSPTFNGTISVNVTGSGCGAPTTAQAYVLNATVIPPGVLGFITLWPNGATQPTVSTLNAVDGTVTSNMAIVSTTNGSINAFASNPTHLVLDIFGYFAP